MILKFRNPHYKENIKLIDAPLRFLSTALMLASFKKGESTDSKYENLSCWVNLARLIKASLFAFPIIMK